MNASDEPDNRSNPPPGEPLAERTSGGDASHAPDAHHIPDVSPAPDAAHASPCPGGEPPPHPSHDQNFKNLILAYPREALAFFLPEEGFTLDGNFTVRPLRQELPKRRLGDRFFEMDTPLRVSWPDGEREDMVVLFEEESVPSRFSPLRLLHYTTGLALAEKIERAAVVVIFLRRGRIRSEFCLQADSGWTVRFRFRTVELPRLKAADFAAHPNVVARILSVCMGYPSDPLSRVRVYAHAVNGLLELEPDPEKQNLFEGFIASYLHLGDDEFRLYQQLYPSEKTHMTGLVEHLRENLTKELEPMLRQQLIPGLKQELRQELRPALMQELRPALMQELRPALMQEGAQRGVARMLADMLAERFGPLDDETSKRLAGASQEELRHWSLRLLTAQSLDEVFRLQ